MQYSAKRLLAHSAYIVTLNKKPVVYTPSVGVCFWNGSHKALNQTLLCLLLVLYLVTQSACIGIPLQLAVKHMPEYTLTVLYAVMAWTVKVAVLCS